MYVCKSLNYQVAPTKTGLISRGENHSLSWQFLHMRDRKRVRSRHKLAHYAFRIYHEGEIELLRDQSLLMPGRGPEEI